MSRSRLPRPRVVPVLDLRGGEPVHARGGNRSEYSRLASVFGPYSGAVDLAVRVSDALGSHEVYVADLDAIEGRPGNSQTIRELTARGLSVWADVGVQGADDLGRLDDCTPARVIAATETLLGPVELLTLCQRLGPERLVFGLDLRNRAPLLATDSRWCSNESEGLVAEAVRVGVTRVLVLDLARVGTGRGCGSIELVRRLRGQYPDLEIAVGGGVGGKADLLELAEAGADAVLLASALHDGRLPAEDLDVFV